jgi:TP53 regulating kinase-like protein
MDVLDNFVSHILTGKQIALGAEAAIYTIEYSRVSLIIKHRYPKKYMNPILAEELITRRTRLEAKIIIKAASIGVCVPRLLATTVSKGILVMEKLQGIRLDTVLRSIYPSLEKVYELHSLFTKIGRNLALLHKADIVHGDFTVSNIIIDGSKENSPCIIDFGLSRFSGDVEDRAMDLRVFLKSIESSFPQYLGSIKKALLEGYSSVARDYYIEVLERLKDMELRGRYVAGRRKN